MDRDVEASIQHAAEQLARGSEDDRYLAVKDLAESQVATALPLLVKAVTDLSDRVHEEALRGICSLSPTTVFPLLETCLRDHERADLRTAAMEAFPRYGRQATAYLLRLLQDADEEVRTFSAVMLGDVRDPLSLEGLCRALRDPDENVRHAGAEALGKLADPRAVAPLLDCLQEDFWIQYPAVIALGQIGDPAAVGPLTELLDDEMLREAVVEALGKIGDVSAIPVLAGILSRKDTALRNPAIASLVKIQSRVERYAHADGACLPSIKRSLDDGELTEHLLTSLRDSGLETRKNAVITLGWLKEARAAAGLVELLGDYELEEYVVGALAAIGAAALEELTRRLQNPDPKVRSALIRCIGWIEDEAGIRACIPFLEDDHFEVRYQAAIAMAGALDDREVEEALIGHLSDADSEIRETVIEVLSQSRSETLTESLIDRLSDASLSARLAAIRILGKVRDRDAFEPLRRLLTDAHDEIRAEVYAALAEIYPSRLTTEILLAGLSDSSPLVRKTAAGSLDAGARDEAEARLTALLEDPDSEVRLKALEALGRLGCTSAVKSLIGLFPTSERRFQISFIRVMATLRHAAITEFLCGLLREADADLRRSAAEALGDVADPRSLPSLIVALDDPDWSVRSAAVTALGKVGDRRCLDHLLAKIEDPEDLVKKGAILALGELRASEKVNALLPLIYNESLQFEVLYALEKIGILDLESFYRFLERANTQVKCLLVDLLGRLRDPRAVEYLSRILADDFFTVRCRAAKVLGQSGSPQAVPSLHRAQKEDPSEEVRREAARALKRLDRAVR